MRRSSGTKAVVLAVPLPARLDTPPAGGRMGGSEGGGEGLVGEVGKASQRGGL